MNDKGREALRTSAGNIWISSRTMKANPSESAGWRGPGRGDSYTTATLKWGENAPNTTTSCLQASRDGEAPSLALRLRRGAVAAAARLGTQTGTHSLWLPAAVPPKKSRDTPPHTHAQRWPTGWRRGSEEDALGSSLREEPTAGSCRVIQGSQNLHDETERSDPGRGQGATTPATGRGSCGHPVATGRGPPWAPPPALEAVRTSCRSCARQRAPRTPGQGVRRWGHSPPPPTATLWRARQSCCSEGGRRQRGVQKAARASREDRVPRPELPLQSPSTTQRGGGWLQREPWEAAQGGLRALRTCTSSSRSHGTAD